MAYTIYIALATALVGCQVYAASLGIKNPSSTAWTPNPLCPYPSDNVTFLPDPYDCAKYYECYEGNLYVMLCPDNLVWNDEQQTCDYPEDTDCTSHTGSYARTALSDTTIFASTNTGYFDTTYSTSYETTTMPATSATTTEVPATNATTTAVPTIEPSTPSQGNLCAHQPNGAYVANPTDCHRFYECRYGIAVEGTCPLGTAWNEKILNCDYPENVDCS